MKAIVYNGARDVAVAEIDDARIEEPTDALVRPEWFGVYTAVPPGIDRYAISIDTAMKSTGGSYSVALVFKTDGRDHFLFDVWRDRVDFEILKAKAVEAGCDTVMPRAAFSQNLPNLLRRYSVEEGEEVNYNY